MFTKRLRVLMNIRERMSYLRLHSNGLLQKSNLTISHCFQSKPHCLYSAQTFSPGYVVRTYANLSEATESDSDDELDTLDVEKITENGYAYSILHNSDKCKATLSPPIIAKDVADEIVMKILAKNYDDSSPAEVLDDFKLLCCDALSKSGRLSVEKHENILNALIRYVGDYSDEELCDLMNHLQVWYPMRAAEKCTALTNLEKTLDKNFVPKITDMKSAEILLICDVFYHMRQLRYSHFVGKAMKKLGTRPRKLTPGEYLHYMFLFNIARKPAINMYEMEYALEVIADHLEGDELGLVCMAFFKTKTPIRNPTLMNKILERCIKDIDSMGDVSITAVMKASRYSLGLKEVDTFKRFFKAFASRIDRASAPCLVHATHALATLLIYDKDTVDRVIDKFQAIVPSTRLKDLERMLFTLSIFNYPKDTPQYHAIIEEFRNPNRAEELKRHPRPFATALSFLANVDIYPLDLIEKIMNNEYLKETYKNNAYVIGRDYLILDSSLRIDVPEYKGEFLPPKVLSYLTKKYSTYILDTENPSVRVQAHQKFVFEVVHHLKTILGASKFHIDQLLPHHQRADIVICLDENNNCVDPKPYFPELPIGSIKYAPKEPEGYKWLSLILASHNHLIRGTTDICGTLNAKLRQLKRIGYTPIVLPITTWRDELTIEGRKQYLENVLLQNNVNNKIEIC